METLLQDVKYGLRALARNPGFTLVAVVALALGIGANSAIFSVVNAVLLRPLPYPAPDRLMSVWQNNRVRGWHQDVVTPLDFIEWRDENRSFAYMAAYFGSGFNVRTGTDVDRARGAEVSVDFFRVLGVSPAMGRDFGPADQGASAGRLVVLGHSLWKRRFGGDPRVIGSSVTLNSESFTIVGIAPPGLQFPEKAELWALAKRAVPGNPFLPPDADVTKMRGIHYLYSIARLKDGVPLAQARAEMETIAARQEKENPQSNSDTGVEIVPLHESIVGEVRPALLIFLGAVGLVLLIACANVANMSLARAAARRREIAVRTALGASRRRIVMQCLTESVLLALVGGSAGLLFALWGTDLLAALAPEAIPGGASAVGIDLWVLGFTLALSILTGILFGLLPAVQASSAEPQEALREGGRTSSSGRRARLMRGTLVVSEMAIALVLLVGAGLLVKSFLRLQRIDPGVSIDQVLTLRLRIPDARYAQNESQVRFYGEVLRRIEALPGVTAAGLTSDLPLGGSDSYLGFGIEGRPEAKLGQGAEGGFHQVSPGYFRTLGIPILRGRPLEARDLQGAPEVAVVSETLAKRYWPDEDAVGKRITFGTDEKGEPSWMTIVGIVADVRQRGLHADPRAEVYVSSLQSPSRYATLILRSSLEPSGLAASVGREVRAVDGDVPLYDVKTMREVLDGSLAARRFNMALLALFAAVAVLLAGVGLYGVLAYMVTQRTHEIGVRMALGARPRDVLRLVVGQGMLLSLGGVLIGTLGALGLTRLLSSLLVGVAATDPWTFGTVAVLLSGVACLACYVPARRAARVDPLIALRYE